MLLNELSHLDVEPITEQALIIARGQTDLSRVHEHTANGGERHKSVGTRIHNFFGKQHEAFASMMRSGKMETSKIWYYGYDTKKQNMCGLYFDGLDIYYLVTETDMSAPNLATYMANHGGRPNTRYNYIRVFTGWKVTYVDAAPIMKKFNKKPSNLYGEYIKQLINDEPMELDVQLRRILGQAVSSKLNSMDRRSILDDIRALTNELVRQYPEGLDFKNSPIPRDLLESTEVDAAVRILRESGYTVDRSTH